MVVVSLIEATRVLKWSRHFWSFFKPQNEGFQSPNYKGMGAGVRGELLLGEGTSLARLSKDKNIFKSPKIRVILQQFKRAKIADTNETNPNLFNPQLNYLNKQLLPINYQKYLSDTTGALPLKFKLLPIQFKLNRIYFCHLSFKSNNFRIKENLLIHT